ncbi:MAG: 50S ribosomal protein L18 [Nanoarchaeota archaeon]
MKEIGRTIKRRRHEYKTDYKARVQLLSSEKPRIVVRRTNRYVVAQLVSSEKAQDRIIVGVSSEELVALGWPTSLEGSLKSIPAAYLTGLLFAQKAKAHASEAILDIGMQRSASRGRLYAFLAGVIAGGMHVPHNKSALPDEARLIANVKTREAFIKLKGKLATHG